jgi:hypothetical protein
MNNCLRALVATLATVLALLGVSALAQTLPDKSADKTLGVITCASSLCHGSIASWNGSPVNQNEVVVWSRLDKHARAYSVLLNDKSKRIAVKLGLLKPAHQSKVCLDCHAHNPIHAASEHQVSDGVACESCHGASERWIASHTEPGASHAKNLANGMYPSDQPAERAQLCLSCHFGNADKYVSHRIMAAGHPRLSFEMETFTNLQPAHFRVDAAYVQRKGAVDGVKVWAIGQALAVVAQMDILLDPKRGRDGAFPELTLFDCHACHHPMTDARWKPRATFGVNLGPGLVRLNDSNMLMLHLILRQTAPAQADSFKAAVSQLNQAVAGLGDMSAMAQAIKVQARQAADKIGQFGLSGEQLRRVALSLVDDGLAGAYADYAGAEQATMAMGSVVNTLNLQGQVRSVAQINQGLANLRDGLANDETYKPSEFQMRLRAFRPLVATPLVSSTPLRPPGQRGTL